MPKDGTISGHNLLGRSNHLIEKIPVESVEVDGMPRMSVWKNLLVDMRGRAALGIISGSVIGAGAEVNHSQPLASTVIGLIVCGAVYIWSGPERG